MRSLLVYGPPGKGNHHVFPYGRRTPLFRADMAVMVDGDKAIVVKDRSDRPRDETVDGIASMMEWEALFRGLEG